MNQNASNVKRTPAVAVQRVVRCPVELAIENAIAYYPMLFLSRTAVLHQMFVVLGCGYHWSKGELVVRREGNERDEIPRSAAKLLAQHRTKIEHPYSWCKLCNLAKMPKNVKPQWRAAAEEIRAVLKSQGYKFHEREERKSGAAVLVQRVVRVRSRIMLRAYAKVVNSIAHLNDEERRRVMKAANITCGEAP